MRNTVRLGLPVALLIAAVGNLSTYWLTRPPSHGVAARATTLHDTPQSAGHDRRPWSATGKYHKRLAIALDVPGLTSADMRSLKPHQLSNDEPLIGVVVNGQPIAVPLRFVSGPFSHVVNLVVDQTPVSITHCDLSKCTRVFLANPVGLKALAERPALESPLEVSADTTFQPIDLRLGGQELTGQMVLLLDGVRYSHQSRSIPLQDHEFEITTTELWIGKHPASIVYGRSRGGS
jgi:hypothetical protein